MNVTIKMVISVLLLTGTTIEYCCYGYLIDMIDIMAINMSLTIDLHLVPDDQFGSQELVCINIVVIILFRMVGTALPTFLMFDFSYL